VHGVYKVAAAAWFYVHSCKRGGGFRPETGNRLAVAQFRVHRWKRMAGMMEGV
jgi:hypothetical protein